MLQAIAELRKTDAEPRELETLVMGRENRELMRRMTSIGQAYYYAMDLFRGRQPGAGLELFQAAAALEPSDVRKTCRRLFDPKAYALVVVE